VATKDFSIMAQAKKLIEVAMPIKEISAESVRDKSIRNGHISTLHLWWARRPLPVCRAVIFASLVPDPLDENCPQQFKDAVEILLGSAKKPLQETGIPSDAFKPYDDIPYTAAIDKMADNPRNRLMMFIGKFSSEYSINEKVGKVTPTAKLIGDYSLIKWENKDNELILAKARKLIWVAHNSKNNDNSFSAQDFLADFESHQKSIKGAEQELYNLQDRHIETKKSKILSAELHNTIEAFLDKMPKIFDPFAGGGAIPLEAARLGCRSFGNDINPVAHIIQKGSLEFPQKFGKPITYSKAEFVKLYGEKEFDKIPYENKVIKNGEAIAVNIANRLSFDVAFYANKLLAITEKEIGYLYPADKKGNKLFVNLWVRIGNCENPSCKAKVPLIKQFFISNPRASGSNLSKKIYLHPIIKGTEISFELKNGEPETEGWIKRGNLVCPCCGSVTDINLLKRQFNSGDIKEKILVKIYESDKGYRYEVNQIDESFDEDVEIPQENMQPNSAGGDTFSWGFSKWGQLFSKRQLFAIHRLIFEFNNLKSDGFINSEYNKGILTYLAILINRIAVRGTSFGKWHILQATVEHLFGRQAIQMNFDYPEINPFGNSSGSGLGQLDWIIKYIESESPCSFSTKLINASSGDKTQFENKFITASITDPPYYDAIAYADISDFFYVWLKRTLFDVYPLNFATPQTPKTEECTALKHHHNGSLEFAKSHFENKLLQIFDAIEHQTSDIVSIMFAHQSTEAWTTLCNSILGAKMNITGSWATDTEITGALKTDKAFLSSSVTVCAKPAQRKGIGDFKEVKKAVEKTVSKEVDELYSLGFRGADLLTACFGQAVSEFGKYEKVEKADGSEVTVADLLEMARESAFNALLKGFDGDDFTKFYIGWLQLYSFAESDFDDAAKFSRVGLSINVAELFTEHILIKNGNKQTLGTFEERLKENKNIGDRATNFLIDQVHRAMALYKGANRPALLQYISKVAAQPESSFWRVITSLCEVLPNGSEDHKQALGLLTNKDSLIRESKTVPAGSVTQPELF
jgi:putative DNA methylase